MVRHFAHLPDDDRGRLFEMAPGEVDRDSRALSTALGATLYTPASRPDLAGV